jgi:hypothetical protein
VPPDLPDGHDYKETEYREELDGGGQRVIAPFQEQSEDRQNVKQGGNRNGIPNHKPNQPKQTPGHFSHCISHFRLPEKEGADDCP